jgi:hypothetical protein
LYLQHKDQIEGNNNANATHSTHGSSVTFEEDLILGSFATTAAPLPLQNLVKYDTYAYVASQDVEVIVHQDLCENEGHIAKFRESETKSELCDSTHYDLEGTNNENVRDTPQTDREFECKSCEDIFEINTLTSTTSVFFPSVQVCNKNEGDMVVHDVTILVERDEKGANQPNQLYAAQNIKLDEAIGEISGTSSMILALPQLLTCTKNDSDLNMQNIVVSDYDKAHVLNRLNHTVCADLVVSHDHNFAEHLQFDNPCSVIYDIFYALIWLIYMILCTHISSTMLLNNFGDMEMNTHSTIISAIEHNPNLCADLIEHVDKFDHNICHDNNICALIDPCNIFYANKNHQFQLISGGEFFAKLSPNNCLFYTMLDTPIDVNKMLENISMITSSRSLNIVHSCKFTFIFIGEHVVNKFYVHAICITDDKLADLKSNMLGDNSCDLYFPNEMTQLFSACNFEPSMSFPSMKTLMGK